MNSNDISNTVLQSIYSASSQKKKQLFVLIDPDKFFKTNYHLLIQEVEHAKVDLLLVGGSLIADGDFSKTIQYLKDHTSIPVCIFPGSFLQIDKQADAIFFLSLISGRNPEFLIGNQVMATPALKKSNLEIIPVGYMLIDGGKITAVQYISNSNPIPSDKPEIASCTALAGEYLGMKCIFMDAGSGAVNPISGQFVSEVKKNITVPLIVGGGIRTPEHAKEIVIAGADAIVIGNAAEKNPHLIRDIKNIM